MTVPQALKELFLQRGKPTISVKNYQTVRIKTPPDGKKV